MTSVPAFFKKSAIAANGKLIWSRLTLSKITFGYFLLAVMHATVQVLLLADAFRINLDARNFLDSIIQLAGYNDTGFTILEAGGPMFRCTDIPALKLQGLKDAADSPCNVIWSGNTTAHPMGSNAMPGGQVVVAYGTSWNGQDTYTRGASSSSVSFTPALSTSSLPASTPVISAASTPTSTVTVASTSPTTSPAVSTSPQAVVTITVTALAPTSTKSHKDDDRDRDEKLFEFDHDHDDDDDDDDDDSREGFNFFGRRQLSQRNTRRIVKRHGSVGSTHLDPNTGKLAFITVTHALNVTTPELKETDVELDPTCVKVLQWPVQKLDDTGREDLVFMFFHVWAAGMSIVALLNESMPHIVAAALTHLLTTAWTGFQIAHTAGFRREFLRVTQNGACNGANLLPEYWAARGRVEIPALVLNCIALVVLGWLSWKLVRQFGWQTFKRVGASMTVNYVYKLVLGLSVVLQLSLFFIITSYALWIDQVCSGPIGRTAVHSKLYRAIYIIVLVFLFPWVASGWFGVRRERKIITAFFLGGAVTLMAAWGSMFSSNTFRLVFLTWRFFAMISIISIALSVLTLALGIMCRLNFGKNQMSLDRYLRTRDEKDDVEPAHNRTFNIEPDAEKGEKIEFPSSEIPTYSFSNLSSTHSPSSIPSRYNIYRSTTNDPFSYPDTPPVAYTRSNDEAHLRTISPSFVSSSLPSSDGFSAPSYTRYAPAEPAPAVTANTFSDTGSRRSNSVSSQRSTGSTASDPFAYDSPTRSNASSSEGSRGKGRWVIE